MNSDTAALLAAAATADAAVDLLATGGPPAALAARVEELLVDGAALLGAPPRATWNLVALAGELAERVDVFRAAALFHAVTAFLVDHAATLEALDPLDDRACAAHAAYAVFLDRPRPALAARPESCLMALERARASTSARVRRAAEHGAALLLATLDGPTRSGIEARLARAT